MRDSESQTIVVEDIQQNAALYCELMEFIKWRVEAMLKTLDQGPRALNEVPASDANADFESSRYALQPFEALTRRRANST